MDQKRCAQSDSNHVWPILMKSVLNEKYCFLKSLRCAKKNQLFFRKVEIFLAHLNHLVTPYYLVSYTFWFNKFKKKTFSTFFLADNCPSFHFKGQKVWKISNFMESLINRNCQIWPQLNLVFYTIWTVHEYLGHFLTVKGKKVG